MTARDLKAAICRKALIGFMGGNLTPMTWIATYDCCMALAKENRHII